VYEKVYAEFCERMVKIVLTMKQGPPLSSSQVCCQCVANVLPMCCQCVANVLPKIVLTMEQGPPLSSSQVDCNNNQDYYYY